MGWRTCIRLPIASCPGHEVRSGVDSIPFLASAIVLCVKRRATHTGWRLQLSTINPSPVHMNPSSQSSRHPTQFSQPSKHHLTKVQTPATHLIPHSQSQTSSATGSHKNQIPAARYTVREPGIRDTCRVESSTDFITGRKRAPLHMFAPEAEISVTNMKDWIVGDRICVFA